MNLTLIRLSNQNVMHKIRNNSNNRQYTMSNVNIYELFIYESQIVSLNFVLCNLVVSHIATLDLYIYPLSMVFKPAFSPKSPTITPGWAVNVFSCLIGTINAFSP